MVLNKCILVTILNVRQVNNLPRTQMDVKAFATTESD